QFFRAVIAVAEIHEALRLVCARTPEIHGLEAEALNQVVNGLMVAVDELATPLAHETIGPGGGIGVHATSDAVGRFIDAARETGVLQRQSRSEAGNSGSDDSDAGHASSPGRTIASCSTDRTLRLWDSAVHTLRRDRPYERMISPLAQTLGRHYLPLTRLTRWGFGGGCTAPRSPLHKNYLSSNVDRRQAKPYPMRKALGAGLMNFEN